MRLWMHRQAGMRSNDDLFTDYRPHGAATATFYFFHWHLDSCRCDRSIPNHQWRRRPSIHETTRWVPTLAALGPVLHTSDGLRFPGAMQRRLLISRAQRLEQPFASQRLPGGP